MLPCSSAQVSWITYVIAHMGVWITEGQLLRATYVAVMRYGPVNAIGLKLGLGRRLR